MIIGSERELVLFEETLGQCQNTVWLISTCGKQYDLKNPLERCLGIAEMLKYQSAEESTSLRLQLYCSIIGVRSVWF